MYRDIGIKNLKSVLNNTPFYFNSDTDIVTTPIKHFDNSNISITDDQSKYQNMLILNDLQTITDDTISF